MSVYGKPRKLRSLSSVTMDSIYSKENKCSEPMDVLRQARQAVRLADQKSELLQYYTTQQLMHRVKDLKFWSKELQRELQELTQENVTLLNWKENVDHTVYIIGDVVKVNEDSINARKGIVLPDKPPGKLAPDPVGQELWNEHNYASSVLKYFNKLVMEINRQVENNHSLKKRLLRDLNQKQEAVTLDNKCATMTSAKAPSISDSTSTLSTKVADGALYHHSDWLKNTQAAINQSSKERSSTKKLVQTITSKLRECVQGMRYRASQVDATLKEHVKQLMQKSQTHAGFVRVQDNELAQIETAIDELTVSVERKQKPLSMALSRLDNRVQRPGLESCDDSAQHALNNEINNLRQSIRGLHSQLEKAETTKRGIELNKSRASKLQATALENMKLEMDVLREIRSHYPTEVQLNGFTKFAKKKYTD